MKREVAVMDPPDEGLKGSLEIEIRNWVESPSPHRPKQTDIKRGR